MKPLIKYFGGKGTLSKTLIDYFPSQSEYDTYLEAFGGGASVLFAKKPYGVEIYNDLEKNVYSLFKVISDKSLFAKFKEKCDLALYSRDLREDYRRDLLEDIDIVERAYKFFYVNRVSVNGVGGFSLTANFIRRTMSKSISDFLSSIDRLPEVHDRLSRVIIENQDGIELIEKFDRKRTFMYLDPPYAHETRGSARYKVDMNDDTQTKLIDTLLKLKHAKVLLSGYDCTEYKRLVNNGWHKISIQVNTIDGNRKPKIKTEVLWSNYVLKADNNSKQITETLFV